MERIEITKDDPLQPGDIIELHYKTIGLTWIKAAQVAIIESRLRNKPDFELISSSYSGNSLILKCLIREPSPQQPQLQQAGVMSAAIIITACSGILGGIVWLTLDKIYKITESPAGKVLVGGMGTLALAAGVAALLAVLGKSK